MRAVAALPRMRARAATRMLSTATVRRKTGATTQDPTTGMEVPVWETLGTLPFRLDTGGDGNGGSTGVTVGGVTYEQATAVGHVPHDADARLSAPLADGDLLDVAGEAPGVWGVVAALKYDQKTSRRLPVAEEQRPAEWA